MYIPNLTLLYSKMYAITEIRSHTFPDLGGGGCKRGTCPLGKNDYIYSALLWQKEASDENEISCKLAKCVCHLHWHQCTIMMSWLKYLSAGWVFLLKTQSKNIYISDLDDLSLVSFCQSRAVLLILLYVLASACAPTPPPPQSDDLLFACLLKMSPPPPEKKSLICPWLISPAESQKGVISIDFVQR